MVFKNSYFPMVQSRGISGKIEMQNKLGGFHSFKDEEMCQKIKKNKWLVSGRELDTIITPSYISNIKILSSS